MKHLTGIANLTRDEILSLLDTSPDVAAVLDGGSVALVFHEPSTRTRFSFTQAAGRLYLHPVDLNPGSSSEQKGETTLDTCRNLAWAGARAIVLRTSKNRLPDDVAAVVDVPVVNAGDGTNEHPTQALGDALTLVRHFGGLQGLTVAIVGDVHNSRVARSNAHLLTKLGAKVNLVCEKCSPDVPHTFLTNTLEHGLAGADVVMILRWQDERDLARHGIKQAYRIDEPTLAKFAPGAMVMHPGPVNRDVEVTSDVVDGPRSLIAAQVRNGVLARTAVLRRLLDR